MTRPIVEFIQQRYATEHGATAAVVFASFISRMRSSERGAALGYRRASDGPLFLEAYLDAPVEQVLRPAFGVTLPRSAIVEIGSLAGNSCTSLLSLWQRAAHELSTDAQLGVAVLTRPLRGMLRRLGISLHELAPADGSRLGAARAQWGSYYDNDPVVCAGSLQQGRLQLDRFLARRHPAQGA
jgi:Thermostable hemolysin